MSSAVYDNGVIATNSESLDMNISNVRMPRPMDKPRFLTSEMCKPCEKCYGFTFTIIHDDIFVQCEITKIKVCLFSSYGILIKYNKALEVLESVGRMFAEQVMIAVRKVIPDAKCNIDGKTIQIHAKSRREGSHDMKKVFLADELTKFFRKQYKDMDILFDFDSFFGTWVTKEEWNAIKKELRKEFYV